MMNWVYPTCFAVGYFLGMYSKFEYKYTTTYYCKNRHCKCLPEGKCEKITQVTT